MYYTAVSISESQVRIWAPQKEVPAMRMAMFYVALLGSANALSLSMGLLGRGTVAPRPPAGFEWAADTWDKGSVVPTLKVPALPKKAPMPATIAPVVAPAPAPVAEIVVPEETVPVVVDEPVVPRLTLLQRAKRWVAAVRWFAALRKLMPLLRKLASPEPKWPALGGTGGPHRMRGPYPPPPKREVWQAPEGWTSPSKPVASWYDAGVRLKVPVNSWYDAGIRMKPTGWPTLPIPEVTVKPTVASWYDAGLRLA